MRNERLSLSNARFYLSEQGPSPLDLVEPQLTSDPVHRAGQLHASRSGAAAQSGRDFFPIEALVAQVNQLALLLAQPLPRLVEQLLGRNHAARGGVPARQGQFFHAAHGAAAVAALTVLPPHFFR